MSKPSPAPSPTQPWWKIKMLWLVIGGPLAVVIASFITLGLALKHPDEVLKSSAANASESTGKTDADAAARLPAMQARNHAATGGK